MIFVGIDPGNTTGVFLYDAVFSKCISNEHADPAQMILWLNSFARALSEMYPGVQMHVACERYIVSERTVKATREPLAQQVIDEVRVACKQWPHVTFSLQSASDAKNMGTNEVLRQIGWYSRGQRHANDAARHCLLLIARKDIGVFDKLVG